MVCEPAAFAVQKFVPDARRPMGRAGSSSWPPGGGVGGSRRVPILRRENRNRRALTRRFDRLCGGCAMPQRMRWTSHGKGCASGDQVSRPAPIFWRCHYKLELERVSLGGMGSAETHTPGVVRRRQNDDGKLKSTPKAARHCGISVSRFRSQILPMLRPVDLPGRPLFHIDDIDRVLNQLRGHGLSGVSVPADPLAARDVLVAEALRATIAYQPETRRR